MGKKALAVGDTFALDFVGKLYINLYKHPGKDGGPAVAQLGPNNPKVKVLAISWIRAGGDLYIEVAAVHDPLIRGWIEFRPQTTKKHRLAITRIEWVPIESSGSVTGGPTASCT